MSSVGSDMAANFLAGMVGVADLFCDDDRYQSLYQEEAAENCGPGERNHAGGRHRTRAVCEAAGVSRDRFGDRPGYPEYPLLVKDTT